MDESVAQRSFFKENFVLIVGLTLPVLLIAGFLLASRIPQALANPPQYNFVFSTTDYPPNANNIPVSVRLVVKDGVLTAQYVVYEAKSQKVRQLTFGFPADMDKIEGSRNEIVEATKTMKLDTTLQSPDGYELAYDGYSHSGLLNEVFWGGGYSHEPRLRKGASSVRLTTGDGQTYFNNVEFVGWATGSR